MGRKNTSSDTSAIGNALRDKIGDHGKNSVINCATPTTPSETTSPTLRKCTELTLGDGLKGSAVDSTREPNSKDTSSSSDAIRKFGSLLSVAVDNCSRRARANSVCEGGRSSDGSVRYLRKESWLVLLMFCAKEVLTAGVVNSFGVIYMVPLQEFQSSAAFKSWIFNVGRGLGYMSGFMAGPLSTAYGHKIAMIGSCMGPVGLTISSFAETPYLYILSHTILVSMGFGFSHYVLYIHMQKSFHKHRGLATGLFAATRAASGALMPQMANLMSEKFGYRIMMRILAGLSGLSFLFAFIQTLHIPPSDLLDSQTNKPEKNNNNNNNNNGTDDDDNEEGSDLSKTQSVVELLEASDSKLAQSWQKLRNSMDFSVLKEPSFLIFTAVDCLLSFTMTNVFLTLPFFSVERGFEPWVAASLLTTTSVAEVLGGLVIPPLFDVPRVNFLYIFCGLQFLGSILFVVIGFDVDKIGMIVICAVFGLVRSGTVGMCNVFLIRQLTIKRFPSALSAKVLFKFGMFCIGPITGHIVDLTGSYKTSFFIFGGVMAMTGIASATFPCFIKLKKKEAYEVNV